jgi:hypothetical protein
MHLTMNMGMTVYVLGSAAGNAADDAAGPVLRETLPGMGSFVYGVAAPACACCG